MATAGVHFLLRFKAALGTQWRFRAVANGTGVYSGGGTTAVPVEIVAGTLR
jgi:hypothetical protein